MRSFVHYNIKFALVLKLKLFWIEILPVIRWSFLIVQTDIFLIIERDKESNG